MRRLTCLFLASFVLAASASAQIGKRISINAGTPEDRAVQEITAATDPAQKLALLDQFLAAHSQDDMALVAYDMYLEHYLQAQNYEKAYEYGEKALAIDPDGYNILNRMFHAAQQQADAARLMDYGLRIGEILQRFKARPAPEGMEENVWKASKSTTLGDNQDSINYVAYTVFNTAYQNPDPAAKAAQLEKFVAAFPDSPYTGNAQTVVAHTYQQMGQPEKLDAFGEKMLATDPNNFAMLILLADNWSERGAELDKAEAYANKALQTLQTAEKPAALTDEQWAQQKPVQQGLAHSAIGQVQLHRKQYADAVTTLTQAAPLLKSETLPYSRNQLRLGYAYASLRQTVEARAALTQAAEADTPYRARAQEIMNSLTTTQPARRRRP